MALREAPCLQGNPGETDIVLFADGLPVHGVSLPYGFQRAAWKHQVKETSATIIDFSAYRTSRLAEAELPLDDVRLTAPYSAVLACHFYWSFLAWIPFGLLDLPAVERDLL